MDIDTIKSELKSRMEASIDRIHKDSSASSTQATGGNFKSFKDDLYKTIFELIDKHKLNFRNHEESKSFIDELKPTCEDLLTRYFLGQ